MWIDFSFVIIGKYEKSSPDLPAMLNLLFSHVIKALKLSSVSIVISLSGSFLTISEKILASIAICPFSIISPSTIVSIPSSMSLAVNLIISEEASIRIHSKIFIVVLEGTAFKTILTAFDKLLFVKINFIMCKTPFRYK